MCCAIHERQLLQAERLLSLGDMTGFAPLIITGSGSPSFPLSAYTDGSIVFGEHPQARLPNGSSAYSDTDAYLSWGFQALAKFRHTQEIYQGTLIAPVGGTSFMCVIYRTNSRVCAAVCASAGRAGLLHRIVEAQTLCMRGV